MTFKRKMTSVALAIIAAVVLLSLAGFGIYKVASMGFTAAWDWVVSMQIWKQQLKELSVGTFFIIHVIISFLVKVL